ncbi:MAG TPA: lipocalin-like domain-containing protein [Candidatus Binatia bacterium]|nr:lipocalin-like domain-containing protein [Candidatus Binatia bacterium]
MSGVRVLVAAALTAVLIPGCGGPILANPPQSFPAPRATPAPTPGPTDPIPLAFPRDDGPHDRLTEWWYYTGHLRTAEGRRFGFEAVIFRAQRSAVPTAWASHLALTDEANDAFSYAQRSEVGPQVDHSPRDRAGVPIDGFDLRVSGLSPALMAAGAPPVAPAPWRLVGTTSGARITAALMPEEARAAGADFRLDLQLGTADPVPHDGDGFVDFGPAGTSYYYSRMRQDVTGTLVLDGETLGVEGIAWFDHQWGDFISVGGGWDWFAINLDGPPDAQELPDPERTVDLTLSVVRDANGEPVLGYGTLDTPTGEPVRLDADDFEVSPLRTWTSPRTGRTWPSGWRITMSEMEIVLEPTVLDQELDTRATTGVVYWEGSHRVSGTWARGEPVTGNSYVEITRYAE